MTKRKRILSIIILAMLLASMFAITAFAGSETVCTSCWGDFAAMAECEDCGGTGILESDSAFAFSF